jgi:prepilin-type processing-associated H-X9-DG protein
VTKVHLKILQCPSARADRLHVESATGILWGACGDYAAVLGVRTGAGSLSTTGYVDQAANPEGAMPDTAMRRLTDVTDGTSNTVLIAEVAGRPGLWRAGRPVPLSSLNPDDDRLAADHAVGGDKPGGAWAEQQNAFYLDGSTPDGVLKPGPCAINCTNNFARVLPSKNYDDGEVYSFHPGGANCLFVDGSAHFLRAGIDIRVFARLVTRAGGEASSAGEF